LIMIVGPMPFARVFGWRMRSKRCARAEIRRSDETKRVGRMKEHRAAKAPVVAGRAAQGSAHRAVPPTGSLRALSRATIQ
jgi:hypothetical protein